MSDTFYPRTIARIVPFQLLDIYIVENKPDVVEYTWTFDKSI